MSENKDLIARLEAAEAEVAAVRAELAKAQEPEPWARWKPENGDQYWFVAYDGPASHQWDSDYIDCNYHNSGNCFPTEKAAERHAKRIRSMVPTCPVPKMGETFWEVCTGREGFYIYSGEWTGPKGGLVMYLSGRVFASKEAAKAWIAKFADAWTTLEDAS